MVSPAGKKAKASVSKPVHVGSRENVLVEIVERKGASAVEGPSRCCNNCGLQSAPRRRDFSEQAWSLLLLWNEITPSAVAQPICDVCYDDLRETLIDRNEEVESLLQDAVGWGQTLVRI